MYYYGDLLFLNSYYIYKQLKTTTVIDFFIKSKQFISTSIFFSESDPGFISNVSPMKKAKKGTQYYHCILQTSPTKAWRVVGFNQATHTQCQHYEKTGNPMKLLNVKEDNGQFLVNQTTTLLQMTNSDVTFTSTPLSSLSDNAKQSSPAVASNIM